MPLDDPEDEIVPALGQAEGGQAAIMPNDAAVTVDFEDENGEDGEKALEYSRSLKMEYDPNEVEFWFTQLENEMYTCGIKSQWMKRCILVKNLPPKVQADVKSLLVLKQTQAPTDLYKKLKQEILRIHAPKCEENFKKALTRVLVGLPSQLGQTLINDICDKPIKLDGCCCAKAVYCLFCLQLPVMVRTGIADLTFNKDTYQAVFQTADKIFLSTKTSEVNAGIAAINTGTKVSGEESQVSAFNRGGGNRNRNRGGGGGNKPNKPQSGNSQSGKPERIRHKSNPPSSCCDNHYRYSDKAWFCMEPLSCPYVNKCVARPGKKNNDDK